MFLQLHYFWKYQMQTNIFENIEKTFLNNLYKSVLVVVWAGQKFIYEELYKIFLI